MRHQKPDGFGYSLRVWDFAKPSDLINSKYLGQRPEGRRDRGGGEGQSLSYTGKTKTNTCRTFSIYCALQTHAANA